MRILLLALILLTTSHVGLAQQTPYPIDSLSKELMRLDARVNQIDLKLDKTRRSFRRGIFMATLGYSVTIAGGLMLGRDNDNLGRAFLYTGGALGVGGTVLLVTSFNNLKAEPYVPKPPTLPEGKSP